MSHQPLALVGDRLAEIAKQLTDKACQRAQLDAEIEGLLAEVRALGIPGAVVPSPNGTADAGGPRNTLAHQHQTMHHSPWPRTEGQPRFEPPDARLRIGERVLMTMVQAGGPISVTDLAAALHENISRVRTAVRDLYQRYGRIDRVDRGLWVVNQQGLQKIELLKATHLAVVACTRNLGTGAGEPRGGNTSIG